MRTVAATLTGAALIVLALAVFGGDMAVPVPFLHCQLNGGPSGATIQQPA